MVLTNERQVIKMKEYRVQAILIDKTGRNEIQVECRDCGNIHNADVDCQVCDLQTKTKINLRK